MQVFKLCLKVIKKNLKPMLIYVLVFITIAVLVTATSTHSKNSSYSDTKADVAFISEENTPLVNGLKQELAKSANFVNVADNANALQDALYFRDVTYIIRIPKGFTDRFMRGENVQIEKTTVPDSVYNTYVDMKINRYLNTAMLYIKNGKDITQEILVNQLKIDLGKTSSVALKAAKSDTGDSRSATTSSITFTTFYFTYMAYVLPAILIFGIAAVMQVFNNKDLSRRSFCSPITARNYNFQFLLANAVFSVLCWLVLIVPCTLFDPKNFFSSTTPLQLLNSFAFLFSASSLSYLIGNLVKNRSAISALSTVCSLGPSFIGGVFIRQVYLNDTVLKIASFTPTYWYVKANEQIGALGSFDYSNLAPAINCMLVEIGFAIAFIALGLVIGKRRRVSD